MKNILIKNIRNHGYPTTHALCRSCDAFAQLLERDIYTCDLSKSTETDASFRCTC